MIRYIYDDTMPDTEAIVIVNGPARRIALGVALMLGTREPVDQERPTTAPEPAIVSAPKSKKVRGSYRRRSRRGYTAFQHTLNEEQVDMIRKAMAENHTVLTPRQKFIMTNSYAKNRTRPHRIARLLKIAYVTVLREKAAALRALGYSEADFRP